MLRILVADPDLVLSLKTEKWFLHPARYTLATAATAAQAAAEARRARPDLAVLAAALPDAEGLALLRQLRALPGCAELPAVVTADPAAAGNLQYRQKLAAAGCRAVLPRPVSREAFLGAIQRVGLGAGAPSVRVPVGVPATLVTPAGSIAGQALNVSRGGIYVATDATAPVAAPVRVTLTLPRFTSPLTLPGRVRWVNRGPAASCALPPGLGIEFVALPPAAQSALNLYILSSPHAVQI